MKILRQALLLSLLTACATMYGQVYCGVTMNYGMGSGNVCPCSGNRTYFLPIGIGTSASYPGCSGCSRYLVYGSGCSGVNVSESTQAKLVRMAMPRDLLIIGCTGGLYPAETNVTTAELRLSIPFQSPSIGHFLRTHGD